MNEREHRDRDYRPQPQQKGSIEQYEEYLYGGGEQTSEQEYFDSDLSFRQQMAMDPFAYLDTEEDRRLDEELIQKVEAEERNGSSFSENYYENYPVPPEFQFDYTEDDFEEEEELDSGNFSQQEPSQIVAFNYLDAGWGEIANTENLEQTTQAEAEVAQEVLAGALKGDFNEDPTFWSDIGQIVTGLIPVAGQLGDARDLIHALDDITNQEGYKKIGSWATLVLIIIGFIPGVGDAIKSIGKRGIRYLDHNRILKRIGEWLGDNIISPILERVGDLTAPLVGQIKDVIRRKLAEAQEIAQQLGEGVDNVIDDVTGRPQVATEGAGNVPVRMETEPPVRGNEPSRMEGNQSGDSSPIPSPPSGMSDNLINIRSTLDDPRAVEAFDEMFGKMRGNSANMERAIEGIRKKGTNLEESMISKWEKANRTAFGAAVKQIPDALARGQKLRDEVQAFKDANPHIKGMNEWLRRIKGETDKLNEMQRGMKEATPEKIQGTLNNLNGVEAEFRYAQKQPGVIGVSQKMSLDGLPKKVDVDVVADNGKTWIDNKNVKPFGLESSTWKGEIKDNVEKGGLKKQVERQLRAAQQNPVDGVLPKVVIEFPQGVSREVAEELQRMGVEVRGNIVNIP